MGNLFVAEKGTAVCQYLLVGEGQVLSAWIWEEAWALFWPPLHKKEALSAVQGEGDYSGASANLIYEYSYCSTYPLGENHRLTAIQNLTRSCWTELTRPYPCPP